jgi:O-antigen ligase
MHAMGSAKEVPFPSLERIETRLFNPDVELGLRFDRAIEILLIALIAFVPWPFGSVHAWAQEVIIAAATVLGACFAVKLLIVRRTRLVRSWTYLPIALFISLALFQLLPLPHGLLRVISPNTLQTKSRLLADLPDVANAPIPLTFYANATTNNLRLLLACVVIFVVALNVLRTRRRIRRMLIAISVVGGLVILLALAQDMTGTQKIYWTVVKPIPLAAGGPFIGHNDFPLFANLTIGAAIALLTLMRTEHRSSRSTHEPMPPWRIAAVCALIAVIVLGACAVFLSLSRSGVIALGAASICITIVAAFRAQMKMERWLMAICLLVCFAVSFYLASDSVNRRLATMEHPFEQYSDRWQIVKDILAAWPQFPLFGTGLGTHEVVYPMFERLLVTGDFDHAENEFAQMLEETGAIGLAAVVLFVGIIVAAFFHAVRRDVQSSVGIAALGLGLGLLAVFLQSFFGFGEHMPANAILTSVECALLLNIAQRSSPKSPRYGEPQGELVGGRPRQTFAAVLMFAAVGMLIISLPGADRARQAAAAWGPVRDLTSDYLVSPLSLAETQFDEAMSGAYQAHRADPSNVQYCYSSAAYSWYLMERLHDPKVRYDLPNNDEKANAIGVVHECNEARKICSTYGPAVLLAGEVQYFVLNNDSQGIDMVRLATLLAPTDPEAFIRLAWIEADNDNFSAAMEACRRYLNIQGMQQGSFDAVVELWVSQFHRPHLAMELAGNDPDRQLMIVSVLRNIPDRADFQAMATQIETKAKVARRAELVDKCSREDASGTDLAALAEIYRTEHDLNRSIDCYQRALAKQYDQMDWHLNLARVLLAAGRASDAVEEASICLRRQPHMAAAEQLISDAEARTGTPDKP